MSFLDLKHQEYAERTILRAMARKRIPHAYIFHGPDGVGKEKFARACARLFLCEAKGQAADSAPREACGTCPGCRAVAGETHPDLHIVHRYQSREHPDADVRKRKGLELGVDVIRHFLIDCVGLTSTRGRGKIFIVREADRITPQAQNALLKTLEEPPQQTFLFLLVSSPDRLLPTFLSRCQSVRFDALPSEFITAQLTPLMPDLSTQHVEWYARSSCGSLGWAVTAAKDELFELNERIVKGLAALHQPEVPHLTKGPRIDPAKDNVSIARKVAEADKNAKAWAEEADGLGERYRKRDPDITDTEATRRGLETIFQLASNWYSDVLRSAGAATSPPINSAHLSEVQVAAQELGIEHPAEAIGRLVQAERQLDLNVNTQLCVECLLHDLALLNSPTSMTRA